MPHISRSPITIAIPVYNQASTLAETLDSVLAQTLAPAEIVVSENHSTDGTREVLSRYQGRVRIVRPPSHLGMMENWNYCVEQVASPWFALLSGDDLARPTYIESLTEGIARVPDAVLVRGDWDFINESGSITQTHRQLSVKPVIRPPAAVSEQLFGPKVCIAAFAAQMDMWRKAGGFDCRMRGHGDWALWLSAAEAGAIVHVSKVVSGYREASRPDLERKRLPLRILDEHYTFTVLYPRLAKRWSLGGIVRRAQRERLLDLLGYAGSFPADVLTEEDKARLAEMAGLCGLRAVFTRWSSDPKYRPLRPVHALKRAARRCAHRLLAKLR